MTEKLEPGCLQSYRLWKAGQLNEFNLRERELKRKLLEAAPVNLHEFLEQEGLVTSLVEHGTCTRRFYREELKSFGFISFADFGRRIKDLAEAWKGVAEVEVRKYDGGKRGLSLRSPL